MNGILVEQQSGFRHQHSTETALLSSTNEWLFNMDRGLLSGVLFLDLKKAFDTVDHHILLSKLELYGIKGTSLKWFESYVSGRSQICSVNSKIYIQHARNGGEKSVDLYLLDGYHEETHTAYEVHGCFWHGKFVEAVF